jgi:hypothetical protein
MDAWMYDYNSTNTRLCSGSSGTKHIYIPELNCTIKTSAFGQECVTYNYGIGNRITTERGFTFRERDDVIEVKNIRKIHMDKELVKNFITLCEKRESIQGAIDELVDIFQNI